MANNQAQHRQELEKSVIKSDIINSKLGLIFGFSQTKRETIFLNCLGFDHPLNKG